jgi:hypothetical protein
MAREEFDWAGLNVGARDDQMLPLDEAVEPATAVEVLEKLPPELLCCDSGGLPSGCFNCPSCGKYEDRNELSIFITEE